MYLCMKRKNTNKTLLVKDIAFVQSVKMGHGSGNSSFFFFIFLSHFYQTPNGLARIVYVNARRNDRNRMGSIDYGQPKCIICNKLTVVNRSYPLFPDKTDIKNAIVSKGTTTVFRGKKAMASSIRQESKTKTIELTR